MDPGAHSCQIRFHPISHDFDNFGLHIGIFCENTQRSDNFVVFFSRPSEFSEQSDQFLDRTLSEINPSPGSHLVAF